MSEKSRPNYDELIRRYNPLLTLKLLGSLQLFPSNHGKNVLFEEMARIGLLEQRNNHDGRENAYWEDLKAAIETYSERIYLEDEPINAFTENVVFAEGNYIVYPGIYGSGSRILNELLECIFLVRNEYPDTFKKQVNDAAGLLLHLSNSAAQDVGHTRHLFDRGTVPTIELPDFETASKYDDAITFPKKYINTVCENRNYDPTIVNEFVINFSDPLLENDDPDSNRTLRKPLFEDGEDLVLYMPTGVVSALIDFIYEMADKLNCLLPLRELLEQRQFEKACLALKHTDWQQTNHELPTAASLRIKEATFRFDNQKFAYVCFVGKHLKKSENITPATNSLQKRNELITHQLSNSFKDQPCQVFSVFVLSETGEDLYFMWPKALGDHYSLVLTASELETIAYSDDTNSLTLWKFAKTFARTSDVFRIDAPGGTLDAFFAFLQNGGSFYDSDSENPIGGTLFIPPGVSNAFRRKMQEQRDEHATVIFFNRQRAYDKVIRYKKYAPIYREKEPITDDIGNVFRLVIETYKMPIWVVNRFGSYKGSASFAKSVCEGIAFWLQKMESDLKPILKSLSFIQFEIEAVVDERLQRLVEYEETDGENEDVKLTVQIVVPTIQVHIPYEFLHLVRRPDNEADKHLMKAVLNGLVAYVTEAKRTISLTEEGVKGIVEKNLQPENAKMFLFSDASWNPKLDNRGLATLHYIDEADTSYILDHLISYLPKGYIVPVVIETKEKKLELCNKVVSALVEQIQVKIQPFDGDGLLKWLIRLNEKAINVREFDRILVPARIACFSSFDSEVKELFEKEEKRVSTSQALRTLIEFVAANPPTGIKWPSYDDVEELLAWVDQLISWGSASDGIWKDLDDPQMGLLPSGRIGVTKTLQRVLQPFALSRTTVDIHNYIKNWKSNFQKSEPRENPKTHLILSKEFDDGFQMEFGIGLRRLTLFAQALIDHGIRSGIACNTLQENALEQVIQNYFADARTDEIGVFTNLLTLKTRSHIGKPQPGFAREEIYPWRHKRMLSYLNRPMACIEKESQRFYYYGYRHLADYLDNLYYLLEKGKFTVQSEALKSLMGKVSSGKGNPFRQIAMEWFVKHTDFEIIPYEVDVAPKGHLKAERPYGDIDLLLIDHKNKIIYSIECKNISGAKTMYEMWSEVSAYLGEGASDDDAKIVKHLNRHKWLEENKLTLNVITEVTDKYQIKSLVLTAEEIPLTYLEKHTLPLPIIGLTILDKDGIQVLEQL